MGFQLGNKRQPQWMIIYDCPQCGMDSGLTEQQPLKCFYCDTTTGLVERERKPLTAEVMAARMKLCAERTLENLQKAQEIGPDSPEEEKMLLEALAKAQEHRNHIYAMAEKMISREKQKKQKTAQRKRKEKKKRKTRA